MNTTNNTHKEGLFGPTGNQNDTELVGSRIARINPNIIDQSGAAIEDDDLDETAEGGLLDEPTDEEGNPTGGHDHVQDDNYALGGHVTRSGSV